MQYAHGGDIYTYKNLLDFSINVNPLDLQMQLLKRQPGRCRGSESIPTARAGN